MEIKDILRENPQYAWINEFNLSARILEDTRGDGTIVFDNSTWEYKLLSLANLERTGVVESAHVHKTLVNDGIIYFMNTWSRERARSKNITELYANRNLYKRFKAKKQHEVSLQLKRIKKNMGEQV